jgi:hypothetical protein
VVVAYSILCGSVLRVKEDLVCLTSTSHIKRNSVTVFFRTVPSLFSIIWLSVDLRVLRENDA